MAEGPSDGYCYEDSGESHGLESRKAAGSAKIQGKRQDRAATAQSLSRRFRGILGSRFRLREVHGEPGRCSAMLLPCNCGDEDSGEISTAWFCQSHWFFDGFSTVWRQRHSRAATAQWPPRRFRGRCGPQVSARPSNPRRFRGMMGRGRSGRGVFTQIQGKNAIRPLSQYRSLLHEDGGEIVSPVLCGSARQHKGSEA